MLMHALALAAILAECISVTPKPHGFFNAHGAGYGRFTPERVFVIERVVRGPMQVGERIVPPVEGECVHYPPFDSVWLVTRSCWGDRDCFARWVGEADAPPLLAWLERSHLETHEAVLAKAIAWAEGKLAAHELREWLDTLIVQPRGEYDDGFVLDLRAALQRIFDEDVKLTRAQRRKFIALARAFPAGTSDEFDAKAEAANPKNPVYRDELESALLDALQAKN